MNRVQEKSVFLNFLDFFRSLFTGITIILLMNFIFAFLQIDGNTIKDGFITIGIEKLAYPMILLLAISPLHILSNKSKSKKNKYIAFSLTFAITIVLSVLIYIALYEQDLIISSLRFKLYFYLFLVIISMVITFILSKVLKNKKNP